MIKFKEEPFHLNCHKTFLVSLLLSEQNTFDCEGKTKQHNLIFIDWAQQIMINLYHFSIVQLFFFFQKQDETSKCYKICEQWHRVKCHTINISYSIEIHSNKPSACLPDGGWRWMEDLVLWAGTGGIFQLQVFQREGCMAKLKSFIILWQRGGKRRRYKHEKRILWSDYSVNSFFTSELQYKQNTKDLENTLQSRNFN